MPTAASDHYERQARLAAVGVAAAARAWATERVDLLSATLATLQAKAAVEGERSVARIVVEQGLTAPAVARVNPRAFTTASNGQPLDTLLRSASSLDSLKLLTVTQIADSGRVAAGVSTVARPTLTGHVRHVGPTCCSRCAILAGRFYRWSTGFQRHPGCRCTMVPTTSAGFDELVESPDDLWRQGRITDLTQRQQQALEDGADLGRLVNLHKRGGIRTAGGGIKSDRKGKPTPEAIYRLASDRDDAIRLLKRHGYIT